VQWLNFVLCFCTFAVWVDKFREIALIRRLRKISKRLLASSYVCASVRLPHRRTRLQLEGLSWNLIFKFFLEISRKFEFHYNLTRVKDTSHEDQYKFLIIFHLALRIMINISDKRCRENSNTFCVHNPPPPENRAVYEVMWKNSV
jgi:hypothetical protein